MATGAPGHGWKKGGGEVYFAPVACSPVGWRGGGGMARGRREKGAGKKTASSLRVPVRAAGLHKGKPDTTRKHDGKLLQGVLGRNFRDFAQLPDEAAERSFDVPKRARGKDDEGLVTEDWRVELLLRLGFVLCDFARPLVGKKKNNLRALGCFPANELLSEVARSTAEPSDVR